MLFASLKSILSHTFVVAALCTISRDHDDIIKWKNFPLYWPFVRGIHQSPMNSPHKGQWRGALMFSLIFVCINGWGINGQASDLRRHRAHYDFTVMLAQDCSNSFAIALELLQSCTKSWILCYKCILHCVMKGSYHVIQWKCRALVAPVTSGSNSKDTIFKLISWIDNLSASCKIGLGWVPQ